jgi:hypothetical protein
MNDCKYCGAVNPPTVFNCLKCNAAMPTPAPVQNIPVAQVRPTRVQQPAPMIQVPKEPQFTSTSGRDWLIYFGVAFGVIALFAVMLYTLNRIEPVPATASAPRSSSSISGISKIKSPGGILLATSEENFAEMMRAAVAGNDAYLVRMGIDGKVFRLQDGIKIKIVDGGFSKSKVSALEGNQAGRAGWLANEFIGQ